MNPQVILARQQLRTPRAAAVAGILFAVLFVISMALIRLVLPEDLSRTECRGLAPRQHGRWCRWP